MEQSMNDQVDRGELLQRFVEDLPDCAVFVLDVEGRVLTWNAGARSILGYVAEEIVGQPLARLYASGQGAPAEALGDALLRGRHEEKARFVRKDGTALDVQSVLIPLYDAREQHVGFGHLSRDLATGAGAGVTAVPVDDLAVRRGAQQVLVVDDDEQIRAVAVRQLTSLGYRVIAAPGGAEALELLQHVPDVDLLFVDVMMPNSMGGREVAERAKSLRPGLKVLFASGYFEGALVDRGEIAPSEAFLVKPYRKKDLAEKVQQVLSGR
jgi:PAS domain S-box-containing protein